MADKKQSLRHKREFCYILVIVLVGGILAFSFVGPDGYLELRKARVQLEMQRERVDELRRSNEERLKAIEALRSDPEAIERLAREKGYGRENEIIQQLPDNSDQ